VTARRKPATEHDCARDAIGRRTAVGKTGSAFAQTDTVNYGYNDRSEVMSGVAVNDATYNYGYSYDPIGNRLQSSLGQQTCDYTSNQLNQYTAVSCLPPAPAYDDDGNMTEMPSATGSWTLTWDTENRLISAESATARLEFQYDFMSRRVQRKTYSGTPGNWTLDETILFLYDGWNLILEQRTVNQEPANRTYTWGLDLSQTLQGADGVGGLLAATIHGLQPTTYVACYDANGNVSEYLDAATVIAAHYEYAPFGGLTAATGSKAADFPHRFSTKYLDAPTGLYYYGYRYYAPQVGRWVNRDPTGEKGGTNVFAAVVNDQANAVDPDGSFRLPVPGDPGSLPVPGVPRFRPPSLPDLRLPRLPRIPGTACCQPGNRGPGGKYNRITHCCRQGEIHSRLVQRPIASFCCHYTAGPLLGLPVVPDHCWVSTDNGSWNYGLYPKPGSLVGQGGPDDERGHEHLNPTVGVKVCLPLMESPCVADFDEFLGCMETASLTASPYIPGVYDCRHWALCNIVACYKKSMPTAWFPPGYAAGKALLFQNAAGLMWGLGVPPSGTLCP